MDLVPLNLMASLIVVIGILFMVPLLVIALIRRSGELTRLGIFCSRRMTLPRGIVLAALIGSLGLSAMYAWMANLGGQIRHLEITSWGT